MAIGDKYEYYKQKDFKEMIVNGGSWKDEMGFGGDFYKDLEIDYPTIKNFDYLLERIYKELQLITGNPVSNRKDVSTSGGNLIRKMDLEENLENIFKILNDYRKELHIDENESQLPDKIGDGK